MVRQSILSCVLVSDLKKVVLGPRELPCTLPPSGLELSCKWAERPPPAPTPTPTPTEGRSGWQTVVPPEKTHVDSLTFGLTDWFLSFYSRRWRIPASNMEIILWVSQMRLSSEVFSSCLRKNPGCWFSAPASCLPALQTQTSLFLLRRDVGGEEGKALSPGSRRPLTLRPDS